MESNIIHTRSTTTPLVTEYTTLGELLALLNLGDRPHEIPTPKKLREEAGEPIATEERCKVYMNGFAVYENETGRTLVWLSNCTSFTYRFDPMKDSEKGGEIKETVELPEGFLESQPWPIAVTLIGDHQVERLSAHRKGDRKEAKSVIRGSNDEGDALDEMEGREDYLKKAYSWREEQFGENPETAYIRKETHQEMLKSMTEKQREVFILYFKEGYTQQEIGDLLGISKQSVNERLEAALAKARKNI